MGVESPSGESPAASRVTRSRSVRTALRKALEERRRAADWSSSLEVSAAIAARYAEQVDALEGVAMVKAAEQLTELMVTLGLTPTPRAGVNPGDGSSDSRTPDERERLHLVMDGPPAVGDTTHG